MVTLYSTDCPKCKVLERKLNDKGIKYEIENDIEVMQKKGFMSAPILEVDENIMDFNTAIEWIDN